MLLRVPMPNAPLDLAEKVKAKVIGQVSEVADQVCDRMLIATSAVLLKNRDGLGGPHDMVGFVGHASPRFSVFTTAATGFVARAQHTTGGRRCSRNHGRRGPEGSPG